MQQRIKTFYDPESLSLAAAQELTVAMARALEQRGRCSLVLSGGSSPRRLYELLAGAQFCAKLDWTKIHIFWTDERCVMPDDARSNYHLARSSVLQYVPLPPGNIHRMPGEIDPQQAARKSSEDIRSFFDQRAPGPVRAPSFDCVLLGMGADGHIASLFPGDESALRAEEPVIVTRAPEGMPVAQRLSMSLPLLAAARTIFFIVFGRDKQKVLDRVLDGTPASRHYPAARICARASGVWFVAP